MKYYLKHLFELYLEYMKLALSGIVLSTIALTSYSVLRTGDLLIIVAVVVASLGMLIAIVARYRLRVVDQKKIEERELERRETEAQEERAKERLEEAKNYLRFSRAGKVADFREAALIHEMALLVEQLQAENISQPLIEEAIDRFLTVREDPNNQSSVPAIREKILSSIISDIVISQKSKENDRLVAG
jgi:hypothetical protein